MRRQIIFRVLCGKMAALGIEATIIELSNNILARLGVVAKLMVFTSSSIYPIMRQFVDTAL